MKKEIENLEDKAPSFKRMLEVFTQKVESLSAYDQSFSNLRKELTLEVESLRSLRYKVESDLTSTITEAIEGNLSSVLPTIIPQITGKIVEKTESSAEKLTKDAERLQTTIDRTIKDACQLINTEKEAMTRRKVCMIAVLCLCSVGTALSISYFYPTHIQVMYQMTEDMAHSFFVGESLKEMHKELTPKQKKRLEEIILKKRRQGMER